MHDCLIQINSLLGILTERCKIDVVKAANSLTLNIATDHGVFDELESRLLGRPKKVLFWVNWFF